jgi:predicted nucleotidyltransferase
MSQLACEMINPLILPLLRAQVPDLLAVYAFGSRVHGTANAQSDLDLAVLVAGYADPILLWDLSAQIADIETCEVDLVDFRAASTVMQYQILTRGVRCWALDERAAIYEAAVLSDKLELDSARAALLQDIKTTGQVYV